MYNHLETSESSHSLNSKFNLELNNILNSKFNLEKNVKDLRL